MKFFLDTANIDDVATVPSKVVEQRMNHPRTDVGLERFIKDWEKVKGLKK